MIVSLNFLSLNFFLQTLCERSHHYFYDQLGYPLARMCTCDFLHLCAYFLIDVSFEKETAFPFVGSCDEEHMKPRLENSVPSCPGEYCPFRYISTSIQSLPYVLDRELGHG